MAEMTTDELSEFLSRTRQAILVRATAQGAPTGAPVWFDWDGEVVRMFSSAEAPKVAGIRRDPRIAVVVSNDLDESPAWVRFEGEAVIDAETDARPLAADVLAPRYWNVTDPDVAAYLDQWRAAPAAAFVIIELRPSRIASNGAA